ncbi:MAG: hypothetical protein E7Z67_03285 [Thermoplasmata archaeon]|nr:hypothetical protein [Thermoplasmata archaeon]
MSISDEILTLDKILKEKNAELNGHRKSRDKFHDNARDSQVKRDNFRKMAQDLMKVNSELKKQRNTYNELTREAKSKREDIKIRIEELRADGVRDLDQLKAERDSYHRQVVEYHAKSQEVHAHIEENSEKIDLYKKMSDQAHEQSLKFREAADKEHQEFVRCLDEIKAIRDELPDDL